MPFPQNGILDNFNRANETPLGNGTWTGPLWSGDGQLNLVSNAVVGATAGFNESYWSAQQFNDCEVYVTVSTVGASAQSCYLFLHAINPNSAALNCYELYANKEAGTDTMVVNRIDNAVSTQLGATISREFASGDRLGFQAIGPTLRVFHYSGGAWSEVDVRSDTTYSGALGYIAIGAEGTTYVLDDFGGGAAVSELAGGFGAGSYAVPDISFQFNPIGGMPWGRSQAWQWQPLLDAHDPDPPFPIEEPIFFHSWTDELQEEPAETLDDFIQAAILEEFAPDEPTLFISAEAGEFPELDLDEWSLAPQPADEPEQPALLAELFATEAEAEPDEQTETGQPVFEEAPSLPEIGELFEDGAEAGEEVWGSGVAEEQPVNPVFALEPDEEAEAEPGFVYTFGEEPAADEPNALSVDSQPEEAEPGEETWLTVFIAEEAVVEEMRLLLLGEEVDAPGEDEGTLVWPPAETDEAVSATAWQEFVEDAEAPEVLLDWQGLAVDDLERALAAIQDEPDLFEEADPDLLSWMFNLAEAVLVTYYYDDAEIVSPGLTGFALSPGLLGEVSSPGLTGFALSPGLGARAVSPGITSFITLERN